MYAYFFELTFNCVYRNCDHLSHPGMQAMPLNTQTPDSNLRLSTMYTHPTQSNDTPVELGYKELELVLQDKAGGREVKVHNANHW